MGIAELNTGRSILYIPGTQSYNTPDSARVTPIGGQIANAGVSEAFLGVDGKTPAEFPSIIRPRGFSFDGSNDRITVPNSSILSFGDGSSDSPFSIALMIRANIIGNDTLVSKNSNDSSGEYRLQLISNGQVRLRLIDDSEGSYIGRASSTGEILPGVNHVIISTYSGSGVSSGVKLYRDWEQIDASNSQYGSYTAMEPTVNDLIIGDGGGLSNYDGLMLVPPMIFDFELTPIEVSFLASFMREQYESGSR